MKCEKCGNDYPSQYYFATEKICRDCFAKLSVEEKEALKNEILPYETSGAYILRVGFGRRFAATLIDMLIYSVISLTVMWQTGYFKAVEFFMQEIQEAGGDAQLIEMATNDFFASVKSSLILGQLIPLLYFTLEIMIAGSLGKLIMGLRIGNEDGTTADKNSLITRYLVKNSSSLLAFIGILTGTMFLVFSLSPFILLVLIIGYFFILSQKRQGFHDMISKTAIFLKEDTK